MILQDRTCEKKRSLFRMGLAVTLIAMVFGLAGCAAQEQKEPEESSAQQEVVEVEPEIEAESASSIPNTFFPAMTKYGAYSSYYCLTDLEGTTIPYEVPDMKPMGGFSNGFVFVTWESSEYDEEWDTEFDKVTHYGLVDETGALKVDLTDLIHSYDWTEAYGDNKNIATVSNAPTYVDGRLVLCLDWHYSYDALLVLDEKGNLKFTVGDEDTFKYAAEDMSAKAFDVNINLSSVNNAYCDGVLALNGRGDSGSVVLDTEGSVLYRGAELDEFPGKGYVIPQAKSDKDYKEVVVDYSGNTVFDASSINVEGDIGNAHLAASQANSSGVVCVQAEKINPHGGDNKKLAGLYSISTSKWIVPLSESSMNFQVNDGYVWVMLDDESFLTVGYGAKDANKDKSYSCILDLSGAVVADYNSSILAEVDLPVDFLVSYLGNGYWELSQNHNVGFDGVISYIEENEVEGCAPVPQRGIESALYPNNEKQSFI